MDKEVIIMEFLNEKNMIVDGVDKYYVSELKRVYGSAEWTMRFSTARYFSTS